MGVIREKSIDLFAIAFLTFFLFIFGGGLSGCGGGEEKKEDSLKKGTGVLSAGSTVTVLVINQAVDSISPTLTRAISYIEQQFTRDVSPRYQVSAHCQLYTGALDSSQPTILVKAQEAQQVNGLIGSSTTPQLILANSFVEGNLGTVCINSKTAKDWPMRIDHVALNLLDTTKLIGQPYEDVAYHPITFSTAGLLDNFYWLCDWVIPPGATNAFGKTDSRDFAGIRK